MDNHFFKIDMSDPTMVAYLKTLNFNTSQSENFKAKPNTNTIKMDQTSNGTNFFGNNMNFNNVDCGGYIKLQPSSTKNKGNTW